MKPAATPATRSIEPSTLTVDTQLMQDYLQTAGILINLAASPAVAAFQNNDGDSEAVVIDVNGNLQHVCREPLSDSGWNMYGLGAGFGVIAAIDSAALWAIGLNDTFWQNNQGRWTQCQIPLPSGAAMQVSAGTDGTVWALDEPGNAYAMGTSPMQTSPLFAVKMAPVTIRDSSNLLHLFCIDQTGALWTIGQSTSAGGWASWVSLGTPAGLSLTTLAAGSNQDGRSSPSGPTSPCTRSGK